MKNNNFSFIVFFAIASIFLHYKSYDKLPSKIHGWAQSDHYVLALGFIDNDFDFFHPQTYSLSNQMEPDKAVLNPTGITAVDFPIVHYTVGFVMKTLNTTDPWVYRSMMLLWSFIALFHLFRTLVLIKGFWEAILVVSFVFFQPVYAYYQNGFHVSMAAFNSLLIGISFLLRFLYFEKNKYYYLGILFLTFSGLIRFTHSIFLIAVACVIFIDFLNRKRVNIKLIPVILGMFIIGAYFIYNKHLSSIYGSVFLNKPIIADSFSSLFRHIFRMLMMYFKSVMPIMHILVFGTLLALFFKEKLLFVPKLKPFHLWFIFSFLGVFCFNLLMSWSLSVHDYYSLDTWFPVLVLIFIFMVLRLDFSKYGNAYKLIIVVFIAGMFSVAMEKQYWKYRHLESDTDAIVLDFKNSNDFLNKFNIEQHKTVVICPSGWNIPMMEWRKKVHRIAWKFKEKIPKLIGSDFDLIITQNASFDNSVMKTVPNFNDFFVKIDDNGLVSVWKLRN